jgi:hypothetical protein
MSPIVPFGRALPSWSVVSILKGFVLWLTVMLT